jgi:flagellar capping protein FliD
MAEINPNVRPAAQAKPAAQPQPKSRPLPTNAEANRLTGLASGLNTDRIIDTMMAVEKKRLEPMQNQKVDNQVQLEALGLVKTTLEKLQAGAKSLAGRTIWDGKLVESSDEDIVTATGSAGAKPGKHTLIVDRLALNHQIASQGYENADTQIGQGKFKITVGENSPTTVTIDASNNTLTGLKDAINLSGKDVQATIIKTGNKERPNQLVLTSQKTGSQGRIKLEVDLKGGETPVFENEVEAPSEWKGVGAPEAAAGKPGAGGAGASDTVVRVVGDYKGSADRTFTFTVVQSGQIGGDKPVQLRWKDDTGRSGQVQLDALNYAPGQPVEFTDGLALVLSKGEVLVGDSFNFRARTQRTSLSWWLSPEQRTAAYSQPSGWSRQTTHGAPVVEGPYTGEKGQKFTLTVQSGGQVGSSQGMQIEWKSEDGDVGVISVGDGYTPGTKLALTDGLTLSLNPGVLAKGQQSTFSVEPKSQSSKWWLSDEDRAVESKVLDITNWTGVEQRELGEVGPTPELPPEIGPRQSNVKVTVAGKYAGDEAKVYTFTASRDGTIGTTKDLRIHWEDEKGTKGDLTVGEDYTVGTPLPFDAGLSVAFAAGRVFKDDLFTVRTRTATIQAPQDAQVRFGATELGGGLEITSSTNELENVIDGVKLTLVAADPKPVNITIKGDTKQAVTAVLDFVKQYNDLSALIIEATKYDKEKNEAGPLQANRELPELSNQLAKMLTDPVAGLPKTSNMIFSLGVKLDNKGMLTADESAVQKKVEDNFAAVADLFREKGESTNSAVVVVGMSDATRINAEGYPVDVQQIATQGYYLSPALPPRLQIPPGGNRFQVTVDGRRSEEMELEPKEYTVGDYARALQNKITNDKQVGDRGVRVMVEGNRIRVLSGRFGTTSGIAFSAVNGALTAGVGLLNGESAPGKDVAGTIAGRPAEGSGQLLKSKEGDDSGAAGLRLLVKLNENQLSATGPESKVTVTRGVASRIATYLAGFADPNKGQFKRMTDTLRSQITTIDAQLSRMEERIEAKRHGLQEKFSRLEVQMSKLKSQQSYMAGQLGGGGGGGGMEAAIMNASRKK